MVLSSFVIPPEQEPSQLAVRRSDLADPCFLDLAVVFIVGGLFIFDSLCFFGSYRSLLVRPSILRS